MPLRPEQRQLKPAVQNAFSQLGSVRNRPQGQASAGAGQVDPRMIGRLLAMAQLRQGGGGNQRPQGQGGGRLQPAGLPTSVSRPAVPPAAPQAPLPPALQQQSLSNALSLGGGLF